MVVLTNSFRGSGQITPSDQTDPNPLNGWLYGGPGFKSRRPDELKHVKPLLADGVRGVID